VHECGRGGAQQANKSRGKGARHGEEMVKTSNHQNGNCIGKSLGGIREKARVPNGTLYRYKGAHRIGTWKGWEGGEGHIKNLPYPDCGSTYISYQKKKLLRTRQGVKMRKVTTLGKRFYLRLVTLLRSTGGEKKEEGGKKGVAVACNPS